MHEGTNQNAIALTGAPIGATVGLDAMCDEFVLKSPRSGGRSLSEDSESLAFISSVTAKKYQMVLLRTAKLMIANKNVSESACLARLRKSVMFYFKALQ
ncbi:hypothetical protein NPIL_423061 [Nephila pilipes]|uniref:Uncharacterized protein n=1 Tax=Nephila pilipes TaxID=299642 RepID=A0A8X6Q2F1_NEPPI|nr:hypothetical protein NPIL_423061 [Nephila pilipes]